MKDWQIYLVWAMLVLLFAMFWHQIFGFFAPEPEVSPWSPAEEMSHYN